MFASRLYRVFGWLLLIAIAPIAVLYGSPQRRQSINSAILKTVSTRATAAAKSAPVAVRPPAIHAALQGAAGLSLRDGQAVATNYVGDSSAAGLLRSNAAQPLALANGDFDSDGVQDLVSGYAAGSGGIITIHRGNIDALWPYGAALRSGEPPAFLPNALAIRVPEQPDFIGTGDFDADGHWDIVTAHLGSSSLYFLRGDGRGNFAAPQRIALSGSITAFATGEMNRADGLTDIVVGITNANGSQALVFESPSGAANATPETFALPAPAASMVLGLIEGGPMRDLAIGAGNQIVVVHGRDRKLSLGSTAQNTVAQAQVTQQVLPFSVKALALGHFSDTAGLAALGDDGAIHLMQNSNALAQAMKQLSAPTAAQPVTAPSRGNSSGAAKLHASSISVAAQTTMTQTIRQAMAGSSAEWKVAATVAAPATATSNAASMARQFISAHVSSSQYDDLILLDSLAGQVHVLSSRTTRTVTNALRSTMQIVSQPMALAASLDVTGSPAAVLPIRVNQHGLKSLVTLQAGQSAPVVTAQAPAAIFTVTNTLDIATSSLTAPVPPGSLRQALIDAQNSGGTAEIVFNIPTSDPGFNPATGTFLIQPLSLVPPGNDDDFALPPSSETVTIDAYTQPGASPNTLVNGDNAKPLIEINGSLALTPGGIGLELFQNVGAVIRGIIFTGWGNEDNANPASPTGGIGVADGGFSDFLEGNFVGVDATGTVAKPNLEGVNLSQGALIGPNSPNVGGDIFGGTVPQARNLVSGNSGEGIVAEPGSIFVQIQGNYIGTDRTGTLSVPNTGDGVFLPGTLATLGGALPGSGNLISGNLNYNVDVGDAIPNGSSQNNTIQGNIIGPDLTGMNPISFASGIGIVNLATNALVGGTSPAARNIISGNGFLGIDLADESSNNLIQGNYIGVDPTGTKAVPNGNGLTGSNNVPSSGIAINTHTFLNGTPEILPPFNNTIGGVVAGAGNVISGNTGDGVSIMGFDNSDPLGSNPLHISNFVQGNIIGADATGVNAIPNTQNGLHLLMDAEAHSPAANITVGGSGAGIGNIISFNTLNGVLIEGTSSNNPIAGNTIQHNGGTGVRVVTGTGNTISRNSIFANGALGIDLDATGPNAISHCQVAATGANNLQNAPTLTAGSGTNFISATATDPHGNTSEFSNTVAASLSSNVISLLGNFDSTASTTYTIEFFTNTAADASGFGQGQTFLASTTVTTSSTCAAPISDPVNVTQADVSVSMTYKSTVPDETQTQLAPGPDFGQQVYTATVVNNGAATAHNVVLTDVLPATLQVSSTYCNFPTCQSPITTTAGNCTVAANTLTCNLGTLISTGSAVIKIPVQALNTGSIANTVTVTATETDPIPANNSATVTLTSQNPFTQVTQVVPIGLLTSSPDTTVIVSGTGYLPGVSVVTFTDPNGVSTNLPATAFFDNQTCGFNSNVSSTSYCQSFQVTLPHSLIGTAGKANFTVTNPGAPFSIPSNTFTLADTCTFTAPFAFTNIGNAGTGLDATILDTLPSVPSCTTTVSADVPWIVPLAAPALDQFNEIEADIAFAPNSGPQRTGDVTFAGQTITFTQAAGDSTVCTYTLTPPSATLSSAAGNFSVLVTPSAQSCSYFVNSFAPFATVAANSGLLGGTATVNYTVTANTGGPQNGTLLIGPIVFPITQNPASTCFFTLSSNSANFPTGASTGSVNVIASLPTCPWTAANNSPAFVNITSGASGTGNGTIQYSVAQNSGGGRNAIITVANQAGASVPLNITQASLNACSATLSPSSFQAPAEGASNGFTINLSLSQCSWNAVSNNPTALSIVSANSGTGSQAAIAYTVTQNTSTSPRTLTITAGCQTFTITQAGAGAVSNPTPVITTLSPTGVVAASGGFTLTVNGSGFVSGATVSFGGASETTSFVSSTQLTAAITAADVASVGTPAVIVTNPTPGGGASNSVNFNVTATTNPVPTVTSLSPTTKVAGSAAFSLVVTGTNFVSGSVVNFNGAAKGTTFNSATQLTASILAADVLSVGTPAVTVTNPTPGGGTSTAVNFSITAATNPVPTIITLSPSTTAAGSAGFSLIVTGTNFVSGSVVNFNGAAKSTTFNSATQLTAAILAADVTTVGTPGVTVTNPTPGGGTSTAATFTITAAANPAPAITTLVPSTIAAGSASFSMIVTGTGFVNGSVVNFNGAAKTTTFNSATQLTAAVLAADVATAGTPSVTVTTPAPGGGTSNSLTFTISASPNPSPALTSLSPTTVSAGSGAFTLTVNGSNFVSNSVVQWNGTARTTTFVSATRLTASITAADVQSATLAEVGVFNPTPGGGTSNLIQFSVTTPVPALASLSPTSAIAGGAAFPLTINGSNFLNTSVVNWNGGVRVTTFVSATQLTAAITAADIATAGTASVTVFTPAVIFSQPNRAHPLGTPTGTTSNALTFTITAPNPLPTLTTISPTTIGAGGAAFTLTLTGTNFINGSTANLKGSPRTTTFVSATQLTAAITAADIASNGTAAITVVNPTPGGGTSNSLTLTITDFSVTATTATQTITAGSPASFAIATATVGGAFPGSVTFSASGLPTGATATFNPASVSAGTATSMTITTTARSTTGTLPSPARPATPLRPLWLIAFVSLLLLATVSLAKFNRSAARKLIPIGVFAVLLISVSYISACSGGGFPKVGSNLGTPAGTFTVTVTGTSGTDVHSTTVTLVVQ